VDAIIDTQLNQQCQNTEACTANHALKWNFIINLYAKKCKLQIIKSLLLSNLSANIFCQENLKQKSLGIVYIQVGGLERAFAISDMLAITVLIPLPFPSTCTDIFSPSVNYLQSTSMNHYSVPLWLIHISKASFDKSATAARPVTLSQHARLSGLAIAGPRICNSLPDCLRNPVCTTDSFKCKLKTYLFTKYRTNVLSALKVFT